ncbi:MULTISPECIES: hypothetical protein [Paraburkholderia]|uniref:hypothetical protein n=1 Tax=Paraburkholderia TaxID=1822464 RepID=UPI0018777817|nr:hypothetical protein [Paraburkholderia terricola]
MPDSTRDSGNQDIDWDTDVDWNLVLGLVDDYWRELLTLPPDSDHEAVGARFNTRIEQIASLMASDQKRRAFTLAVQSARKSILEESREDPLALRARLGLTHTQVPDAATSGSASAQAPVAVEPPVDRELAQRFVDDYFRELFAARTESGTFAAQERFEKRTEAMHSPAFEAVANELLGQTIEAIKRDRATVERRLGSAMKPWGQESAGQRANMGAMIAKDVGRTAVRFTVWKILFRLFRR